MKRCNKTPNPINDVFHELDYELTIAHMKWEVYIALFGRDKETIDMLNEFASLPFRFFQDSLRDSVILSLSKLVDPPKTKKGYEYSSFKKLISTIDTKLYGDLKKKLKRKLKDVEKACSDIRQVRHKRISHNAFKLRYSALKEPSRKEIKIALQRASEFLNMVPSYFGDTPMAYEIQFDAKEACELMLHYIKDLGRFYNEFGSNYFDMKDYGA